MLEALAIIAISGYSNSGEKNTMTSILNLVEKICLRLKPKFLI